MEDLKLIKVINEKIKLDENIDENLKILIIVNRLQNLFSLSCRNGHKETALWLYESSETYCNKKINIYFYYAAFVWSCYFCMEFVIMEIKKGIVVI